MTPSPDIIAAAQAAQQAYPQAPASVAIAQYGLESGWGAHMPPGSCNPFGYKALPGQQAVWVPTREVLPSGEPTVIHAAFRKFDTIADAFLAHAELLATAGVYSAARAALPDIGAYVTAMAAHYATDPHYAKTLMAIIEGDSLTQYDTPAAQAA